MKIDPKTVTLDANDRVVLLAALKAYAEAQTRTANRKAESLNRRYSERAVIEKDLAELHAARATDLITLMEDL